MTIVFTSRFTPNAPSLAGPPTPTGLAASPHTQTQINLTWNPVTSDPGGPGIKDYGLYRIGQGLLAYITATLYTDSGLTQGTTYTYYVTARDLNLVESAQSLPATATTYVGPPVPTGLTAIVNSTTQIQINWNNSSDPGGPGISRYGVYLNGAKQGEVAPVSYLFNGLNPGTTYSFQVSSIDVNNIESAPCTAVLATTQGGAGLTVYHGQSLTFTGTGFGAKSQTLFVHDYGQGPVGSLNSQWSGGWPSACTAAQDNLQTQPLSFAPTGAALGTPDPFVSGLMAGCHGNPGAGANAGYNVNPWVSFTPPTFPYAIYARHWTRADPNWTFHLANGEYNYKMYTLGTGTSAYGNVYWYWNFDPPAIGNNTVVSLGISNDVNGGLQNPDANGNSNYWPGNSSNPNHNYPLTLSPFNSSNGTGGWINQEFEVKVTSTTGTAASGGGYINWWNQFNKVVAYEGSTDTMSDPNRSFALEGYSVQYPYETNFRYLLNCTLDISGPGATHVARVYWSASSSDADGANREVGFTPPGNWSNTSITSQFWQGAFPTGTAVYPVILTESGAKTIGSTAYTIVTAPPAFAPNRPAGLTTFVDRQFNPTDSVAGAMPPASGTKDSFNQTWVKDSGSPAYTPPLIATPASLSTSIGVTIPALPDGNPTAMAIKYPSGTAIGTTPFLLLYDGTVSVKQLYFCCYVLFPSNFNSNNNNMKWLGIEQGGTGNANHILMLSSNGSTTVSSGSATDYRAAWVTLQGPQNNNYGGSNSSSTMVQQLWPGGGFANRGSGVGWWTSNYGTWHMCEWLVKQETVPGSSADGVFESWFDGTLINKATNINWNATSGGINNFNIANLVPYYGGGGSAAPGNEFICVGHFQIAGA